MVKWVGVMTFAESDDMAIKSNVASIPLRHALIILEPGRPSAFECLEGDGRASTRSPC